VWPCSSPLPRCSSRSRSAARDRGALPGPQANRAGIDPRELGLGEPAAVCWSLALLAYWTWMAIMLFQPLGRFQFLMLLASPDLALRFAAAVGSNGCW